MKLLGVKALAFVVLTIMIVSATGLRASATSVTPKDNQKRDVQFIDMMIMHHRHGIEMARLALTKGQLQQLKEFAQKTIDDQQKDIDELERIRNQHFSNQPRAEQMQMGKKKMSMMEMQRMSEMDMSKLQAATGVEFDRTFLDIFIKHHQMAIRMSREEVAKGRQAEVKAMARQTINKQTKDIAEMRGMKAKLGGPRA